MADSDEEWNDFNNLGKKKAPVATSNPKPTPKPSAVTSSFPTPNPKPQTQASGTLIKKNFKAKSGDEDSWDMEEQGTSDGAKVSGLDYDAVLSAVGSKGKKM